MNLHKKKIITMLVLVMFSPGFTYLTSEKPSTAGKIIGFNADDLVVRTPDGVMLLFPFENGNFVGPKAGIPVGRNWNFTHYLVGNWTGKKNPDMIVRDSNGDLLLYPFVNQTFNVYGN